MPRPSIVREGAQEQLYVNWLNYSDPGTGKSVLTGSATEMFNTLIIKSATDNIGSVFMRGYKPDVYEVSSWNAMEEIENALAYENHGYGFVCLDTITLFQDLGLDDIMADLVAQKSHRKVYLPDKGEYGQNMTRLRQWVSHMAQMPFHFQINAHAFMWQEDQQDEERRWPLIGGKGMPAKICGMMNLVTYMISKTNDQGKYARVLHSRKEDDYFAKDGWDALGEEGRMVNPTVPKLFTAINTRLSQAGANPLPYTVQKAAVAKKVAVPAKKAGATAKKVTPAKVAGARKATTGRK